MAGLGLLGFYFLTTRVLNGSWQSSLEQFLTFKYLMVSLITGFGIQVGLWQYLRLGKQKIGGVQVAASAGVSGGTMVACCLHHLTDILPILGLSALSVFLVRYQVWLLLFGVLTNTIGILYMIKKIRQTRC